MLDTSPEGDSVRFSFAAPEAFERYISPKGSVALDGVSLTVNEVDGATFGVNIIPHTLQRTTFGSLGTGDRVNFEIVNVLDRSRIRARIFERGAGETLSSGTGSTAAATAARSHGLVDDVVDVVVDGGVLRISWDESGEAFLEGPAVEVFTGVWPH